MSQARRLEALAEANRVRGRRAQVKRGLRRGEVAVVDLVLDPPEFLAGARVADLLLAVPGLGAVRVARLLRRCDISDVKRIGGLSDRQRRVLARELESRR